MFVVRRLILFFARGAAEDAEGIEFTNATYELRSRRTECTGS